MSITSNTWNGIQYKYGCWRRIKCNIQSYASTCISIRQVLINLFTAHSCFSSNNSENLNRTPWSSECLGWADWDGRRDCQESSSNESRSWRGISTSRSTMSARSRCSLTASINPLRNSSARLVYNQRYPGSVINLIQLRVFNLLTRFTILHSSTYSVLKLFVCLNLTALSWSVDHYRYFEYNNVNNKDLLVQPRNQIESSNTIDDRHRGSIQVYLHAFGNEPCTLNSVYTVQLGNQGLYSNGIIGNLISILCDLKHAWIKKDIFSKLLQLDEDQKENGSLQHEISRLGASCDELEKKNQSLRWVYIRLQSVYYPQRIIGPQDTIHSLPGPSWSWGRARWRTSRTSWAMRDRPRDGGRAQ